MVSAATLVAINFVIALITAHSKKIEAVVVGRPQILIHNGRLFEDVLAALRQAGCTTVNEVRIAVLEINGAISVVRRDQAG